MSAFAEKVNAQDMGRASPNIAPSPRPVSSIPVTHWIMVAVAFIALLLRLQRIATVGVSFDESFCQRVIEFPWPEVFYRLGLDTHPPLFYVSLKLWTQCFGNGVVSGRLLSAIFGVLSVVGMYAFVREAYRTDGNLVRSRFDEADLPAVVAATMLAVAPLQVFWALQIRMYSLSMAMTLWSSYLLIRALRPDRCTGLSWAAYTLSAILLAYSHIFGMFILMAQFAYAFIYSWGGAGRFLRIGRVILSGCCVVIAWLPWLPVFLQQRNRVHHEFYLPKPSWSLLGTTMHELWAGVNIPHSMVIGLIIAQASLLLLLILIVGRRSADTLVALSAVVPVVGAFVISSISQPIVTARYFMFSQVFLIAAISLVICRASGIWRVGLIVVVVGAVCALSAEHYWWRERIAGLPGMRAAVARLNSSRGKDPLVVCNPMFYTSVLTYIDDRDHVYNYLPQHGFPLYQGTPVMRDEQYVDSEWIQKFPHQHLWTLDTDLYGRVPVPTGWELVAEEPYEEWIGNVTIRLYSHPPSPKQ